MLLSLQRLGWKMDTFSDLEDDLKQRVSLFQHSPKMLKKLLLAASLRQCERMLAEKLGPHFEGRRAYVDHIRAMINSKSSAKFCSHSKSLGVTIACDGIWTRADMVSTGYEATIDCVLCGEQDTLLHRCSGDCKGVQHFDKATDWLNTKAMEWFGKPELPAFAKAAGIFPHPADTMPLPAQEGGAQAVPWQPR